MKMNRKIVFLDTETGGLDSTKDQIIQVACIATDFDSLESIEEFEVKIQLIEGRYSQEALFVNSYNPEVWAKEAKTSAAARQLFNSFLRKHATLEMLSKRGSKYHVAEIAGQNVGFDVDFLRAWFKETDDFFPAAFGDGGRFDTMHLARALNFARGYNFENYKLETLARTLGVSTEAQTHDALDDVRLTIAVAKKIREMFND